MNSASTSTAATAHKPSKTTSDQPLSTDRSDKAHLISAVPERLKPSTTSAVPTTPKAPPPGLRTPAETPQHPLQRKPSVAQAPVPSPLARASLKGKKDDILDSAGPEDYSITVGEKTSVENPLNLGFHGTQSFGSEDDALFAEVNLECYNEEDGL